MALKDQVSWTLKQHQAHLENNRNMDKLRYRRIEQAPPKMEWAGRRMCGTWAGEHRAFVKRMAKIDAWYEYICGEQ